MADRRDRSSPAAASSGDARREGADGSSRPIGSAVGGDSDVTGFATMTASGGRSAPARRQTSRRAAVRWGSLRDCAVEETAARPAAGQRRQQSSGGRAGGASERPAVARR
ncbi:hypothetical protein Syun_001214 [Stephania yunnanensis]|uniref:Uncharacterized protein n=1 Tax=Stephania yunnanensis TaxID=152371 RepID=A0AAP0Q7I7_9MAGN